MSKAAQMLERLGNGRHSLDLKELRVDDGSQMASINLRQMLRTGKHEFYYPYR